MKTEIMFGGTVKNREHSSFIEEGLKTWTPLMANERKLHKQNSLKSQRKLSRASSFAKDEDLEKILQDIESINKYKPSSKTARRRPTITDNDLPPEEELDKFFVNVEKRNAELHDLLQAVESSREENDGQLSRITSAGERGSTDSLVEKLMQELDCDSWDKDNSNNNKERQKSSNKAKNEKTLSKLEASASEEELDEMLAELLEL